MKKKILAGIIVLAGLVGVGTAFTCIEVIPTGSVGVQYSMSGGVKKDEVLTQGLKFTSPWVRVSEFKIATQQLYMSADEREGSSDNDSFDVVTKDGKMNVDFEMSYSFDQEKVTAICERYGLMAGEDIVSNIIRGKIKTMTNEVTSQFSTLEAHMEKKGELNAVLTKHLQNKLSEYGVTVESANFTQTRVDAAIEAAITERSKAAQELEAEKQKQEKASLEAQTKKIAAQGEADAALIKAQGEAAANKELEKSITDELIKMKEAEARVVHGWVEVTGAGNVVVDAKK